MAQKTHQQLVNNMIGQLEAINTMIDQGDDCFKVLTQLKATRSGVSSLMKKYIEENFINCLDASCNDLHTSQNIEDLKKLLAELIK